MLHPVDDTLAWLQEHTAKGRKLVAGVDEVVV